jgi:hypothetical protein
VTEHPLDPDIDLLELLRFHVEHLEHDRSPVRVGCIGHDGDAGAVRRQDGLSDPVGVHVPAVLEPTGRQPLRLCLAIGSDAHQLGYVEGVRLDAPLDRPATFVRLGVDVGDPFAVGRPRRLSVVARVCQLTDVVIGLDPDIARLGVDDRALERRLLRHHDDIRWRGRPGRIVTGTRATVIASTDAGRKTALEQVEGDDAD